MEPPQVDTDRFAPRRAKRPAGDTMPGPLQRRSRRTRVGTAAALGLALLLCGCAYFNTFYNAKQFYKDAEETRTREGASANAAAATYDMCIKKCMDLIRYHPNSRYVDDALFMIGMSHYHRSEYVQAQASFRDLLERFPDSDFAETAAFQTGLAGLQMGDAAGAAAAFDRLAADFPKSPFNVEAVYRTALAQRDAQNVETARAALHAFTEEYPRSPFAAEAQVQIARTYYDEYRFERARQEFERALRLKLPQQLRYDAQLHVALSMREQAAIILADPALYTRDDMPDGLRLQIPGASADSSAGTDLFASVDALPDSLRAQRRQADQLLQDAEKRLRRLRGLAEKFGRQYEHQIELAVTWALMGRTDEAISELDQVARTQPRGGVGSQAYYEIGEIHRRLGDLDKALEAYQSAQRAERGSDYGELAQKKGAAIRARRAAIEELRDAPEVLRRWRAANGNATQQDPTDRLPAGPDSLRAYVELETQFEKLAAQLLRIAEIDLLELAQPRLALRELELLLHEYQGSSQSPRAAFAIGWIYDTILVDPVRALSAYEGVMRDYPNTPQARQAQEFATALRDAS
jgi:TolA-binding protein